MNIKFSHGVVPVIVASLVWAFAYYARKAIFPWIPVGTYCFIFASISALVVFIQQRLSVAQLRSVANTQLSLLFWLGFFGSFAGTALFTLGIDKLPLGISTLLEKLQPLFTILFAYFLVGEHTSKTQLVLSVLLLSSAYVVVIPDPFNFDTSQIQLVGILAVVGAAASWGLSLVLAKRAISKGASVSEAMFFRFAMGALCLSPSLLTLSADAWVRLLSWDNALPLLLLIYVAGPLSFNWYYRATHYLSTGTISVIECITPISCVLAGMILLGETYTWSQLVAMPVLLVSGALFLLKEGT